MAAVELSQRELDLLVKLLQSDDSDLTKEIAHTDARPLRVSLKLDKTELEALLAKLTKGARISKV